ncbi:hypothetical protein SAMN04487905_1249 [Actinopolyspora xinjiangensis]|uniref:TrbL/VirB6 plasmid conjugal transfer protein n=1 Tax=Actinopolyspora xinjiangensis TaxID=405564 RepID=A0A1H0X2Q7_9ACTN|nr:hypothetical protein [Actinopolyspora xinjiangensis]SDP97202.1 hypothetical protein SAMN04487905_1249 [Actinopolyspora xinjiangensis]
MRWPLWVWPFDDIGDGLGNKLGELLVSSVEKAMRSMWEASLALLRGAFTVADRFSVFTVDPRTEPVSVLWPIMLWLSGVLALGLFCWQLVMTSLRGGSGFLRLVTGPMQYGLALAVTTGMVGGFLAAADGLTRGILDYGLGVSNFQDALEASSFLDTALDTEKAYLLGICAVIGIIPAGIGFVLEMLFREAAIYVLVITIPITAAGLLANVSKNWFWTTTRWMLACIAMKPVLALTLVLGIAIHAGSNGVSGLLAGIGVLMISLVVPWPLFKLFAFVDPNADAGAAFRRGISSAGLDSYGANSPAFKAASMAYDKLTGGTSNGGDNDMSGSDGEGPLENATTQRFDQALSTAEADAAGTGGVAAGTAGAASGVGLAATATGQALSAGGSGGSSSASSTGQANRGAITASDGHGPQGATPDSQPGAEPSAGSSTGDESASSAGVRSEPTAEAAGAGDGPTSESEPFGEADQAGAGEAVAPAGAAEPESAIAPPDIGGGEPPPSPGSADEHSFPPEPLGSVDPGPPETGPSDDDGDEDPGAGGVPPSGDGPRGGPRGGGGGASGGGAEQSTDTAVIT